MSAQATSPILTVIALAGRRIDGEEAETKRFPLAAVQSVAAALDALFAAEHVARIIISLGTSPEPALALAVESRQA